MGEPRTARHEDDLSNQPSRLWIVSLGDLLTLLLCFFIASIVSGYHRGHESASLTSRIPEETIPQGNTPVAPHGRGTGLALSRLRESVEHFRASDFRGTAELRMTPDAAARMRANVESMQRVVGAELFACDATPGKQDEVVWFNSVRRALELRRQLLDAGLRPDRMRISVLGRECAAIETPRQRGRGGAIAKVLLRERVIDG